MTLIEVTCSVCSKKFLRTLRRFNESKKFNWRHYCSRECQSLAKNKQKTLKCNNPTCHKIFKRSLREISLSEAYFCSRSCAATVNNNKFPKRKPKIKICPTCGQKIFGERKYCSKSCLSKARISPEQIIDNIREFHQKKGRIPFKRELHHYRVIRNRFGTWNQAIQAAGFQPNPVKFAKKFIANDGHRCDSLSEKIIDDWFSSRKIKHQIKISYPQDKSLSVDFLVKDYWIEFFGLDGELDSYVRLKKRKFKIAKKEKLKLIALYPQDLFPNLRSPTKFPPASKPKVSIAIHLRGVSNMTPLVIDNSCWFTDQK